MAIRGVLCRFCQGRKKQPIYALSTGVMKTEPSLATSLGMFSTEGPWGYLTGACSPWCLCCCVCSLTWQCCWEPPETLRYLPKTLPSAHTECRDSFGHCWSLSPYCQVTRAVCQGANPNSLPPCPGGILVNSCTSIQPCPDGPRWQEWGCLAGLSSVCLVLPWMFSVLNSCLCCL